MDQALRQLLADFARDLADAQASMAVVGGLAVGARVQPRFTRDVDVVVATDSDEHAESIAGYLIRCGYRPAMELDHAPTQRLATLRLRPPGTPAGVTPEEVMLADVIFCTCGIEAEIVEAATAVPVYPELVLPTAQIPHLIAMKLLAESDRRLQDRIDLQHLFEAATDNDLAQVPALLDLIHERGFGRDKDLRARFAHFRDAGRD